MEKSLKFLLESSSDADVKKSEVVVKILSSEGEDDFKVKDLSRVAYLAFKPGTKIMKSRVQVGNTYRLFSIEKTSPDTLAFEKTSYLMEDKSGKLDELDQNNECVNSLALIDLKDKHVFQEKIILKVLKVYDQRVTSNGINLRKALLGDSNGTLLITFWRDCVKQVDDLIMEGKVYLFTKFCIDDYLQNKEVGKPKDIVFVKGKTLIKEMALKEIPESFLSIQLEENFIQGRIRFLDRIYEYRSCPGTNEVCGKIVKHGQVRCSKSTCLIPVDETALIADYVVTLVVFDNNHNVHPITAFKKSLKEFECTGDNVQERLAKLFEKEVKAYVSYPKSGDNPILSKLSVL